MLHHKKLLQLLANPDESVVQLALELIKSDKTLLSIKVEAKLIQMIREASFFEGAPIIWEVEKVFLLHDRKIVVQKLSNSYYVALWFKQNHSGEFVIDEAFFNQIKKWTYDYNLENDKVEKFYDSFQFQCLKQHTYAQLYKKDSPLLDLVSTARKVTERIALKFFLTEYYLQAENYPKTIRFLSSFKNDLEHLKWIVIEDTTGDNSLTTEVKELEYHSYKFEGIYIHSFEHLIELLDDSHSVELRLKSIILRLIQYYYVNAATIEN